MKTRIFQPFQFQTYTHSKVATLLSEIMRGYERS